MKSNCFYCAKEFLQKPKHKKFCCRTCKERSRVKGYKKVKDTSCALCNFKAIHPCQLDVDHIDGNHSNNSLENLQTLCANCHRLKTKLQYDEKLLSESFYTALKKAIQ